MITVEGNRLVVSGTVTFDTHVTLCEQSAPQIVDKNIEVSFADVTDLDSSTLALLFFWQRRIGNHQLTLTDLPPALLSLAELYGVTDLLQYNAHPSINADH